VRQTGQLHGPAHKAALAALREARPELSEREAAEQVVNAIYYASYGHPDWFWRGVGG
jgi:hypothetical protein